MRKQLWGTSLLTSVLVAAVTACGSSAGQGDPQSITVAKGASLHRADSCGDLLAQVQADAIAKLDDTIERYKSQDRYGGGEVIVDDGGVVGRPVEGDPSGGEDTGTSTGETGSDGSADPPPVDDVPQGDNSGESSGDGDADEPSGHSETNTQVKDVDEADIVKIADGGERIFLIHGSEFKILKAWPAADTAQAGVAQVAGTPIELFVHEGKATVFSSVYPDDLPDADSKEACWYNQSFTQVSVFDVSGDAPELEREMIFEGNYVSSRRHDGVVRVIVGGGFQGRDIFYPEVDRYDSFNRLKSDERLAADLEQWRENVELDIKNTTLKDWLPERFEKVNGAWEPIAGQCDGFYIPQPGLVESGITQVITFDPAAHHSPNVVAVLGGTETVYANNSSLYLAHVDYRWDTFAQGDGPRTAVHKLDLSDSGASYNASGFVPGVPLNQFSLDETDGVLRIATTINDWENPVENRVFTVKGAEGELSILDRSDALGEERETIK
ncbi:MAG TPA: beta-propeller domain-containing protein, partial [Polyangiaceae bacterium]|nr:beta-propeller domain-containing protein [Polyangiaceae bacterium]